MFPRTAALVFFTILASGLAAPSLVFAAAGAGAESVASPRFIAAQANAGKSVQWVNFLRPVHSYEVVDGHAVLVWETQGKAWLVDLKQGAACRELDRSFAVSVETMSDSINARNGYVLGRDGIRCRISQIREVDVPAMRAAERAAQVASGT